MAAAFKSVFLLLVILLLTRLSTSLSGIPIYDIHGVCFTPGCIKAATTVINSMDRSVDPCENFYKFACGKFLKESIIDDTKTSQTTFDTIHNSVLTNLKMILTEPHIHNEPKPFKMAKMLYKLCMDTDTIEKRGLGQIKAMFEEFGGWPVIQGNKWNKANFKWEEIVYKLNRVGYSVDYFIDISFSTSLKDKKIKTIVLDQPSFGLRPEYLVKGFGDKIVNAYHKYMVDIAVFFGAKRLWAEKKLRDSLDFEISLANLSFVPEESRVGEKMYNPMKIADLQKTFPSIEWYTYLNKLSTPLHIRRKDVINVNSPKYLCDLEAMLKKTPKRIQANYLFWRSAEASVKYLTNNLRKRQFDYYTEVFGKTSEVPRWKDCIEISSRSFSMAISSLYARRFFDEGAKRSVLEMVNNIREVLYKTLLSVHWMENGTRKLAKDKAESMTSHIAYSEDLMDDQKLNQFYEKLEINDYDYFGSVLNVNKFIKDLSILKLRPHGKKLGWTTHSRTTSANGFYSLTENSIQFPAGILQGALFSSDRPRYMNYGSIGYLIGHEIIHSVDDQGRWFDDQGNSGDWWSMETKNRYLKYISSCIIEQYKNYTVEEVGIKLNGVNTEIENIADNGGVKLSYNAYQEWSTLNEMELRLPGLQEYTPRQMFWISAANMWCSKYRPETLKTLTTIGFDSPGQFRVIGPFSDLEEFSNDFKCPLGSNMNPVKKCNVW